MGADLPAFSIVFDCGRSSRGGVCCAPCVRTSCATVVAEFCFKIYGITLIESFKGQIFSYWRILCVFDYVDNVTCRHKDS